MITASEVSSLVSLMRRDDRDCRQLALEELAGWVVRDIDQPAALALLAAASRPYPLVAGDPSHPEELFARLLWSAPRSVSTEQVLDAYAAASQRVRRTLLHLLAARRDLDGLAAIESLLLGNAGPDTLPDPTGPMLDPLLELEDHERLATLALGLLERDGWTWVGADLLAKLQGTTEDGTTLDPATRRRALDLVDTLVARYVDVCDRATLGEQRGDASRTERELLGVLVRLTGEFRDRGASRSLWRMVASCDPRVAAIGAAALIQRRAVVASERLDLIARDPAARALLHDGLDAAGQHRVLVGSLMSPLDVAEARLVQLLSEPTEMDAAPDEIEHVVAVHVNGSMRRVDTHDPSANLHVFRFRVRDPHWSAARGWMIGTSGVWTHTCYLAEDEMDLGDHLEQIRTSSTQWRRTRPDELS